MKTCVLLCFAAAGALPGQVISGGLIPGGPTLSIPLASNSGQVVTGQPFSATVITETSQTLADGNRITSSATSMWYRDAMGRERREEFLPGASTAHLIFISDPVTRIAYTINPSMRSVTKIGPTAAPPPATAYGATLGVSYLLPDQQASLLKQKGLDHGVLIGHVTSGSPAEKAGVHDGDVLLGIDGQALKDSGELPSRLASYQPGRTVTLTLDRDARTLELKATLEVRTQVFGNQQSVSFPQLTMAVPVGKSQVKTEDLGTSTIEGLLANGKRTSLIIPSGQAGNAQPLTVTTEIWTSPDLQVVLLTKVNDPRTGERVDRFTNIVRSEPSPSVFQPPADYRVIPSQPR